MTQDENESDKPRALVLKAEPGCFTVTGHVPTIIVAGDVDRAPARVDVSSPTFRSETRTSADGVVSFSGAGQPDVGRIGEGRVAELLLTIWRLSDSSATVDGSDDQRGVDRWVKLKGHRIALQVVSIPSDSTYWQTAVIGTAERRFTVDDACRLIRDSIERKSRSVTGNTILALDALHAGVLGGRQIADAYLSLYKCPSAEFGFVSVWIVGPTARQVTRLGGGQP